MFNKQEIFDKVARHLITQGARAQNARGRCVYLAEDGKMCAAGCLITKKNYSDELENKNVHNEAVKEAICKSLGIVKLDEDETWFLSDLQEIHDNYPVEDWREKLIDFATKHDLVYSI